MTTIAPAGPASTPIPAIGVAVADTVPAEPTALEIAIQRIINRTPEEILAARGRIYALTPPPRPLPPGKTLNDVVQGTWPGDETDEEIFQILEELS